MADWTVRLIAAVGAIKAGLVGHSMGSLIAIDAAARHPDKVSALSLIGVGGAMPVSPDLLNAAKDNNHDAIDMVSIWGFGFAAGLGGSQAPGLWMMGGGQRVLERDAPGVLFNDLAACNDYKDALSAAAKITAPTTLILGERDMMTPLKSGKQLAAAIAGSTQVVLPGAGHMLTAERPDDVLAALVKANAQKQPAIVTRHCEEHLRRSNPVFICMNNFLDCFASLAMTKKNELTSPDKSAALPGWP